MFYGSHGLHGRSSDQSSFLMIPEDERYDYAHFEFVMRGVQAAREAYPELADQISLSLHCETAEIMTRVHQDGRGGGHAHRAGGLQRLPAAALRGPGGHDRLLPGPRDRAAQHQPAAPDLAQGGRGGAADGEDLPAHRLPPRGHHRAPAGRHPHRARHRRQGQPAAAPARGRRGAVAARARRRDRLGGQRPRLLPRRDEVRRPAPTTSSWPSPASAAPSTCWPAWSARAASGACRSAGSPS